MKKLLCLLSAAVLMASLCACSEESDSTSVKVPNTSSTKVSMTYEEAIVPFESSDTLEKIYERSQIILEYIKCIDFYYMGGDYSGQVVPGVEISNENGISASMNALEEYFKAEQQYTDYIKTIANPVIKDSYLKFIDLAKETYQKFIDNPTKSVVEEVKSSITSLELYSYLLWNCSGLIKAEDYLHSYSSQLFSTFSVIEAYCKLTPEEIMNILIDGNSTSYGQRMLNVTAFIQNITFTDSAEGIDLDYLISSLDTLMGLKDNAYAIAVKAYGSDSQKLAAYEEFIEQATKLYNTVRVKRPEFNDTEYIEKQEFDLDVISKYR